MITIAPRRVFFADLDGSISQCITCALFGFAFVFYCVVNVFDHSKENLQSESSTITPQTFEPDDQTVSALHISYRQREIK